MSVDPRRLLILRDVAAAGSISAGARTLGWTQPAVTQHINALERSAGMPLLLRSATGVAPTEAGRAVLSHADAIAAHLDAASAELEELRSFRTGTVRLAAFPSALATLVPQALKRMAAAGGSSVQVKLAEAEPDEAMAMLAGDEVDLAVVFSYADTPPNRTGPDEAKNSFQALTIGADPVDLILPPSHPAARKPALSLADLADAEWVAGCPRCRAHLVATTRRAGFEPRISHSTDDYVVVQSLVAQGLAVSSLPRIALEAYRSPDVVVRECPELAGRRIEVLFRPGADRVPSVRLVLRHLAGIR